LKKHVIIGSRGSDLALWQAYFVKGELEKRGCSVEIKIIVTQGDAIQHLSFDKLEGKGITALPGSNSATKPPVGEPLSCSSTESLQAIRNRGSAINVNKLRMVILPNCFIAFARINSRVEK